MSDAPIDERYEIAAEMIAARAEIESLRSRLADEQERHAQLQARCFDQGSQSVFDAVQEARAETAALREERALIIQRAENAEAALVAETAKNGRHAMRVTIAQLDARLAEAEALRETRAKELSYVVEACTAALVIRTTHESRDALRDLRAWATNRIDAHLARQP